MEYYNGGNVRFGNNEHCCIKGRGCISLTNELICNNSYWVEGLKHNILSVEGKGNLVASGKQTKGNIFYLYLSESSCFIAQVE